MRVAVTGAGGMLGTALAQVFADTDFAPFPRAVLDVTDLDRTVRTIRAAQPDFVVHAAALTDVDGCETEKDRALLVNAIGARNVAIACEEIRRPIVYISSDYVFDGRKGSPYDEWDDPNPINVYGLSKLLGERAVSSCTNRAYIVRTSWLFGPGGRNFVDTISRLLDERERIEVVADQTGCPTYTLDLATTIRDLLGKGFGIYHATNSGLCTWHEFALRIASCRGISREIAPVASGRISRPARRPAYSVLQNTALKLEGIAPSRRWEDALTAYLARA